MAEHQGLLSSGWDRVARNKRYVIWFYLLNLALAWFGAGGFGRQAEAVLDHSLQADRLLHGFDLGVLVEMFSRPEFGPTEASFASAFHFALLFFVATALFLPGVLQGYASTYRLPREDFFRACGRNLWRFIRLMIVAGVVMGAVAGALFGLHGVLEKKAAESTNELLLPEVRFVGVFLIFLVMTALRIWFDLAQADVVLSDQRAVRRSIGLGFRHAWRNLARLVGSYLVTTIVAAIILVAGLWAWMRFVPPASVGKAFFVSQLVLLLLLIPRFWQRGIAVSYYLENMVEVIAVQPFTPVPVTAIVVEPSPTPVILVPPPEPQGV
jgi:hypothetical protein